MPARKAEEATTVVREKTPPGGEAERTAWLVAYHRDGAAATALPLGEAVVVGRAEPSDLVIADPSLSRRHARFVRREDGVDVEDLRSTNGTLVGGKAVGRSVILPGDEVVLGAVSVAVYLAPPGDEVAQGIQGLETFLPRLDNELVRSRTFGRPFAVLMVGAAPEGGGGGRVSRWCPRIRRHLRPVDEIAVYAPGTVLVLLPEMDRALAWGLASAIVGKEVAGEPALVCGVASYPDDGASREVLVAAVREAARGATARERVRVAGGGSGARPPDDAAPVTASPRMREVLEMAKRLAQARLPVLIEGETGTGKEVLARFIHERGPRRGKPMRCLNCGAIPGTLVETVLFGHERGAFTGADRAAPGVFEQAEGGTVLLDEIGDLPAGAQAAFLRVVETMRVCRIGGARDIPVDVRILAATNRDLDAMCARGSFRQDLLYRLNALRVRLPPLRERPEDIEPLARQFLREANRANRCAVGGFDDGASAALRRYAWPGNVRELRNVIERAVVIARDRDVVVEDLPEQVRHPAPAPARRSVPPEDLRGALRRFERDMIAAALERTGGNQSEAARVLGIPLRTIVRRIGEYGLRQATGGG